MMIQTQHDLDTLCASLQSCSAIALDTEFTRVQTYWPILSIVQISDGKQGFIIDFHGTTLDPAPLISVLTNPHILKILHSCRQDFEIFSKQFGILPAPVFDTQMAALFLYPGEEMGLSRLLQEEFDLKLNKAQQNTDWLRRPLSQHQLAYALSDVEHLHDLWRNLSQKLEEKNRLSWLWEDQHVLLSPQTYESSLETVWTKIKSTQVNLRTLSPKRFLYVYELAKWREKKAQVFNYNRGRVLSDETLLLMSQNPPQTLSEFVEKWGGIFDHFSSPSSLIEELWGLFERANELPRRLWPKMKKHKTLSPTESLLLEKVKMLQISVAEELGISPRILANNEDLKRFCGGQTDIPFLHGWRHQVFGVKALALKVGE